MVAEQFLLLSNKITRSTQKRGKYLPHYIPLHTLDPHVVFNGTCHWHDYGPIICGRC